MILPPNHLTARQSEGPRADHALLLEHHTAPHYPFLGGTHSLKGIRLLWPPWPGTVIKLFCSTSPKTLSPRFNSSWVYRGQISAAVSESEFCSKIEDRLYGETDQSLIHVWAIYQCVILSKLLNFLFFHL